MACIAFGFKLISSFGIDCTIKGVLKAPQKQINKMMVVKTPFELGKHFELFVQLVGVPASPRAAFGGGTRLKYTDCFEDDFETI